MVEVRELLSMVVFLVTFLLTGGLGVLVLLKLDGDRRRGLERLRDLAGDEGRSSGGMGLGLGSLLLALPQRAGSFLLPAEGEARTCLQQRLTRAGFYRSRHLRHFLGAQVLLSAGLPVALAIVPSLLGAIKPFYALLAAVGLAAAGMIAPGLWLDSRTRLRQAELRRAVPDALDMLVLCMEGGVSMTSAMQRIITELQEVHPVLGGELNIIQREMQMGLSCGEAMKKFADRCDLEEVRNLSSVLLQSERFGAGVVKALRIHADTSRQERQQKAEEIAQKAAVKILFPTLLCIFPAIFIVILGPAAYQIAGMLSKMK
ncbi:MAG: type II secretion system F family protein [Planctomycetes bacterium]|nr:type II secretion system F family protein [Planctomycetota bacterium]